jgi:L-proline amide hydrolase
MTTTYPSYLLPADREGSAEFDGSQTWYRITGDLDSGLVPLVVAHGGPGCTHDYLLRLSALAAAERGGRPVIHYDQLGNGRSTHLRDSDPSYWTVELFVAELNNLLAVLGIADSYHLLGQSWGGMLAAEFAVRRPSGLDRLIVANSPASIPLWLAAAAALRDELPTTVNETLLRHEEAGTTDSSEYLQAMQVFYDRHVCRITPNPPEVAATFAALEDDPTVYHTMNGPSEFHVIGTLRDWDVTARLGEIDAPVLVISGEFDEATPAVAEQVVAGLRDATWELVDGASHSTHLEKPERFLELVNAFLAAHD